jgi:hypothetical protein
MAATARRNFSGGFFCQQFESQGSGAIWWIRRLVRPDFPCVGLRLFDVMTLYTFDWSTPLDVVVLRNVI